MNLKKVSDGIVQIVVKAGKPRPYIRFFRKLVSNHAKLITQCHYERSVRNDIM
jgi:hypothetical protein